MAVTGLLPRAKVSILAALAAVVMAGATSLPAKAGPQRLNSGQLDAVSAGQVIVTAEATAVAVGDSTNTSTQTYTATKKPNDVVELGFARGKAYACCGPLTDANVVTDSYADGAIVAGHRNNTKTSNPMFTKAHGNEVIVSVNPPGLVKQ